MATFKGFGVIWALDGVSFTGLSGSPTFESQSLDLSTEADEKLIRDSDGDVKACVYYNHTRTIDLEVIPTGATLAAANASADNLIVPAGTVVVLAHAQSAETDTAEGGGAAGEYLVRNCSMARSNEGEARINMSLYRSDKNDLTNAVAAS